MEAKPNGEILWYGELLPDANHPYDGFATMSKYNGKVSGHFTLDETDYAIHDIGGGLHVLEEVIDENEYVCGFQAPVGSGGEIPTPASAERTCNPEVRVLVLWTQDAAAAALFSGIDAVANMAIAEANQALKNSLVHPTDLRFVLAHKQLLSGFTESGQINFDLNALLSNSIVVQPGTGLRDLHAADCVLLLTNGDYGDFLGLTPSCGPSDGNSFSIVQVGAALSRMTFTHELGHQFGCKHSPGNNNGNCEPDFERPYEFRCGGFLNQKLRITLMEAGVNKKNRIPHFSNPEATYGGHATGRFSEPNGIAETNNARQLREQACLVAGFRSSDDLSSVISGLTQICDWQLGTPKQWLANVTGGSQGVYDLSWQISVNNGVTFGPVLSSTDNLTLDVEDFEVGDFFVIRLTVVASNGETIYDFHTVDIVDCEDPHGRVASGKAEPVLQFAPNPAKDRIFADLQLPEEAFVTITLINSSGVAVRILEEGVLNAGEFGFVWDVEPLPPGAYQIRVVAGRSVTSHQVIIIH
ncbi:MAG: hypothetical protein IPK76_08695 [Lewinellaceae bacterium]|nr:hypothetical protein [Lewinellaceae bacterium]